MDFEAGGAQVVAVKIVADNIHRSVIAPIVRIADFVANGVQFHQGLLLRLGAHPVQLLNTQRHGGFDVPGHLDGGRLQVRRKSLTHVGLPQSLSQVNVNGTNATFPARLKLFRAAQILAVELEVFIDESRG